MTNEPSPRLPTRTPMGAGSPGGGAVLDRDGWRCRRVGRMEVDHVVPLDRGGDPWDMANLQTLCRGCHIAKTAAENRRPRPRRMRHGARS